MSDKLNIQDLIDLLVEKHGMGKSNAENFVREFFLLIEESLEKDKYVKVKGLGAFKLIDVESRESVNVNTGERFQIQGHTKISFTPDPNLRELVNKPFAHFDTVVLNENTILTDTAIENDADDEYTGQQTETAEVLTPEDDLSGQCSQSVDPEEFIESSDVVVSSSEQKDEFAVDELVEKEDIQSEFVAIEAQELPDSTQQTVVEDTAIETEISMPEVSSPTSSDASTMKYFIGIVVFVVLLCGGAITFMYYPDILETLTSPTKTEKVAEEESDKQADKILLSDTLSAKDTIVSLPIDTVAEVATASNRGKESAKEEISKTVSDKDQLKSSATPFIADSLGYTIVGTETTYIIKEGETLTKVSLQFYGTKALWPYIVKHNPGVIKNPDNVPFGTQIKIPKLVKKQ